MTTLIILLVFVLYATWNVSRIEELQREQGIMKSQLRILESQIQRLNLIQRRN